MRAGIWLLFVVPAVLNAADRVLVPAGEFRMGCSHNDAACSADEGPAVVPVPAFLIDRHEVTVADYRRCVQHGVCSEPLNYSRNKYCNYGEASREDHPVNCVDWQQAADYCAWRGGRLPFEAEWEKAARGGSSTPYPWGEVASCDNAILDAVSPAASAREPDGCFRDSSWPVGSRPANAMGLFDMHGNVGEWTANWYAPDAIKALYAGGDLRGPANGRQRVVRGGSWDENRPNLRSSFRNVKPPVQDGAIYGSIGLRCAADPR